MNNVSAEVVSCGWRRVDLKLTIDGELHVLRWRRGFIVDEVLFDERRVATSTGLFGRESMFGFDIKGDDGAPTRLLLTIDTQPDYADCNASMAPRGVRLETADAALVAHGSFAPLRARDESSLMRALRAFGLA